MVRIRLLAWKNLGRRRHGLLLLLIGASVVLLNTAWWFTKAASSSLLPPPPLSHNLHHLRNHRNLKRYLDSIQLLLEPSSSPCEGVEEVPLLVLVASPPSHLENRAAIRETWRKQLPTYFVMGLEGVDVESQLIEVYIEAKQYSDMVVFDLTESYENLTLKTALMLQWTRRRCPQAEALLKTDDDVLVNPWVMRQVVKDHADHQLVGYKLNQTSVHRDEYSKWYLPRWLFPQDTISEYLSGTGYIIYGEYIEKILKQAYKEPIINLEDVYFTHIVASRKLGLTLTHDRRISPFKPWIKSGCSYWGLATAHSLSAKEMVTAWAALSSLAVDFERGNDVCGFFSFLSGDWFLF